MSRQLRVLARIYRAWIGCGALLCISLAAVHADSGTASGHAVHEVQTVFTSALSDVPGKNLVVVRLDFAPGPRPFTPHRHPGSVYVYVTKGAMRLGIEGQPVQVVHAGESFFEPMGALHTVAQNASTTEPASAIAVGIVPEGAPLLTVEKPH